MRKRSLKIIIAGLSITSSWGNGHATTYRALVRELQFLGHRVLFLERDVPWYANNRDVLSFPDGSVRLYSSLDELTGLYSRDIRDADLVIVGSYVPEGVRVGEFVTATAKGLTCFYDIDTPVTLSCLRRGSLDYLSTELIPKYDLYASFTGGPLLDVLKSEYGARNAIALYCSVDTSVYYPEDIPVKWDLGYIGTFSEDRQASLEELLIAPASQLAGSRFVVAGPQYPAATQWPVNVDKIDHVPPVEHRSFYAAQRFTLNITRKDMIEAGFSPSVRLFEAAACATPIISDYWNGLETLFELQKEILVSFSCDDTVRYLRDISAGGRKEIGTRARQRVLREHTAAHRAETLEKTVFSFVNA